MLGHKRLNTTLTYARVHDRTVAEDYYAAMAVIEERLELHQQQQQPPVQNTGSNDHQSNSNGHTDHLLTLVAALEAEPLTESQQAVAHELQQGIAAFSEADEWNTKAN